MLQKQKCLIFYFNLPLIVNRLTIILLHLLELQKALNSRKAQLGRKWSKYAARLVKKCMNAIWKSPKLIDQFPYKILVSLLNEKRTRSVVHYHSPCNVSCFYNRCCRDIDRVDKSEFQWFAARFSQLQIHTSLWVRVAAFEKNYRPTGIKR